LVLRPLEPESRVRPASSGAVSFAELLPTGVARDAVMAVELVVQRGDYASAVNMAARVFDEGQLGGGLVNGDSPALRALVMGLPGDRYLRFREVANRAQSGSASSEDALFALFFMIDAAMRGIG
jgi:hypothetical protein